MNIRAVLLSAVLVALAGQTAVAQGEPPTATAALKQADRLFKEQQWAEAAARYDGARDALTDWHSPAMRRAVEGAVACSAELTRWDDAVARLEAYISHNADGLGEVAGQRLLAGFYLSMPHTGIVQGGRFLRGESGQGENRDAQGSDERGAVQRLERARDVAARRAASLPAGAPEANRQEVEQARIDTDFDLATALTQINVLGSNHFTGGNHFLARWLSVRLPLPGEQEDTGAPPPMGTYDHDPRELAADIPPRPDGTPMFASLPPAYGTGLTSAEKFRFLLAEVERIDTSAHRDAAAQAVFRRAVLAQFFYGPQTALDWVNWWLTERTYHPVLQSTFGSAKLPAPPVPDTKVWQLRDDQALTPVGSWLRVVDLPAEESPLTLFADVEARYPQSTILPEVRYARALYLQGRQQYPRALVEYRAIAEQTPAGPRAKDARAQIQEIEQPGLSLGDAETYFPGERPTLEFTARNAAVVQFTATRFDLIRSVEESAATFKDFRENNLEAAFDQKPFQKYLQKESIHWSETLPPDQ